MRNKILISLALIALILPACDPGDGESETDSMMETTDGPDVVELDPACAEFAQIIMRPGFEVVPADVGEAQSHARSIMMRTCPMQGFTLCVTVNNGARDCAEIVPTDSCELIGTSTWFADDATVPWSPMGPAEDAISWKVEAFALGADPEIADPVSEHSVSSSVAMPYVCENGQCDFVPDPFSLDGLGC